MRQTMAMILAGGKGTRLAPLVDFRPKPAIPFGGAYRIIDFTLSNCLNSNLRKIVVLTQYQAHAIERHLHLAWNIMNPQMGEFVLAAPSRARGPEPGYQGTADAVYQNLHFVHQEGVLDLLVLSGDHVYKMDYAEMTAFHRESRADATMGVIEVPLGDAARFGVVQAGDDGRASCFVEKPERCAQETRLHTTPGHCYANMGVYLFNVELLTHFLAQDAGMVTEHDFGRNILPRMVKEAKVMCFEFRDKNRKESLYWRDIGTLDSYWDANMDLASIDPLFNLYDKDWPVRTYQPQYPPAKFVFANEAKDGRVGMATNSLVSQGCIISGARVDRSMLSPNVRLNEHTEVSESVIMEDVVIGRSCKLRKAIVDAGTRIPDGVTIGYDPALDRTRFVVTEGGVVVVSRRTFI